MDAFHYEHLVVVECKFLATLHAFASREVIARQLYLFTLEQRIQLLVEEREVQGVQMFEVVVTFLVERCLLTVEEVVVEGDADGLDAIGDELDAESFAGGGLTRRRRTGNQYQTDTLALGYLIGNLGNLLLLKCLTGSLKMLNILS